MQELDIEALKQRYLNMDFDERTFDIDAGRCATYAQACGEVLPRYIDPSAADFEALPTFVSSLQSNRQLPKDFPRFGGIGMDAGKAVMPRAPIHPPLRLVGRSHLHDIYTKTGRSGRMIFIVSRMDLFATDETHVASADTRIVIRERSRD